MFGAVKALLSYLAGDPCARTRANYHNRRLVAAALLTSVASVDSEMSEVRRETLHAILRSKFALDDHSTRSLLEEAIAINRNAIDLYRFTRQLNEILDDDDRSHLVQMMWEVAYADGTANDFDKISFGERLICWECRLDGVWSFVKRYRSTGALSGPWRPAAITGVGRQRKVSHPYDARVWSGE